MDSPFTVPHEDVDALQASEGFQLLRRCLADDADFCAEHALLGEQSRQTWLLHRDLLHALIMPVVQLFHRASILAQAALCTSSDEDWELAFSGEARGAFSWLQSFVSDEADWCATRGCPACITSNTLSTEPHMRLTIAASLLSTSPASTPSSETPPTSDAASPINAARCLPPLPHILPALRGALAADPFWGPDYWPCLFAKAEQLSDGIGELIGACRDLDALVSSPIAERTASNVAHRSMSNQGGGADPGNSATSRENDEQGVRLRKSKLAQRQLRLKDEELDALRRRALQCWARAAVPKNLRKRVLDLGKADMETVVGRARSLTCP